MKPSSRHLPHAWPLLIVIERKARVGVALAWIVFASTLGGCTDQSRGFMATDSPCDAGRVCMLFDGRRYTFGFAWLQPHPIASDDPQYPTIPRSALQVIGSATSVTPNLPRAGFDIYRIAGVDPTEVVASDWQGPSDPAFSTDLTLWTEVGLDWRSVIGLCSYTNPPDSTCASPAPPS